MNTSKTLDQAKKFFDENKSRLLTVMFTELCHGVTVDHQTDYTDDGVLCMDQVVLSFEGFSLCCQDSDMNGNGKGKAHYTNCGADSGFDDLIELLVSDERTSKLHASDETHENEYVNDFSYLLCDKLIEHFNVTSYFECNK